MKPLIVANWKMNPQRLQEARKLASQVQANRNVVLCPPFPYLAELQTLKVRLGAQDVFWEARGAYTGEVSPAMLKDLGCTHVILGHSERKKHLGETEEMINRKVKAVLKSGLTPVVCVGEQKRGDKGHKVLLSQARSVLKGVAKNEKLVVTYEPEWAISSRKGAKPAAPGEVRDAVEALRRVLGSRVRILYGGSTDAGNIGAFLKEGGVSGALVGGASLKPKEFAKLVKNASVW